MDELTTRVRNGRSLAQIAKAQGKSVEGLKAAIVNGVQSDLDKAVEDGNLPAEMKNRILDAVRSNVDDIVNGQLPSFGGPPGGFDRPAASARPAAASARPAASAPPGGMPDDSQGSEASFA